MPSVCPLLCFLFTSADLCFQVYVLKKCICNLSGSNGIYMMDLKETEEGWGWRFRDGMWHKKNLKNNTVLLNLIYP